MSQVRSQQPLEIVNGGGGQPCIPMRRDAAALRRRGEETPQTGEGGEDHMAKTRVSPGCAIDRVRVHGLSHGA